MSDQTAFLLGLRGVVNVFVIVLFLTLAALYGHYLLSSRDKSIRMTGIVHMTPVSKMVSAWFVISLGEIVRSLIAWELINFEGARANYVTNIGPMMVSLVLIAMGGACAIRIVTPGYGWKRHVLWVGSVLIASILSIVSLWWAPN